MDPTPTCRCESTEGLSLIKCNFCSKRLYYCAGCMAENACHNCERALRIATRASRNASSLSTPSVSPIEEMSAEQKEKPKQKKRSREEKPKEEKLEEINEIEENFYSGKSGFSKKSTAINKKCMDVAPEIKLTCCARPKEFNIALVGKNHEILPLGKMFRKIFDLLEIHFGSLPGLGDDPGMKLLCMAYDISFLWFNATDKIASCSAYKLTVDLASTLTFLKRERPNPTGVASCHPTAENLTKLLQVVGKKEIQQHGWLGAGQSLEETFTKHNKTCNFLIASLQNASRGIWWVSHCGHSFCLIKRECVPGIEVIDSFANNRGLGYWALTKEELELVATKLPASWAAEQAQNWSFHIPPTKSVWSVEEMAVLIKKLVHKNIEIRYQAQSALVNYYYEPDEVYEDNWTKDQLPYGAFGFVQYDLCPDQQILFTLAQKFFHGYEKLYGIQHEPHNKLRPLLNQLQFTKEDFDKLFGDEK